MKLGEARELAGVASESVFAGAGEWLVGTDRGLVSVWRGEERVLRANVPLSPAGRPVFRADGRVAIGLALVDPRAGTTTPIAPSVGQGTPLEQGDGPEGSYEITAWTWAADGAEILAVRHRPSRRPDAVRTTAPSARLLRVRGEAVTVLDEGHEWLSVAAGPGWVAAGGSERVQVWRDGAAPIPTLGPIAAGVGDLATSPDGRWLVGLGRGGEAVAWETAGWTEVGRWSGIGAVAFHPTSPTLVLAAGSTLEGWCPRTGARLPPAELATGARSLAFDGAGDLVVTARVVTRRTWSGGCAGAW